MSQDIASDSDSLSAGLIALDLGRNSTPVHDLPPEIISDIFILCLPAHGRVKPSPETAPLLLAQICRRWREIALETCQLWCSIYLEFPWESDRWDTYSQTALCLLQTCIQRAKGYPLSLGLDRDRLFPRLGQLADSQQSLLKEISTEFLHFLSTYAAQIYRLEARVFGVQFDQIIPPNTSLPLLQTIHVPSFEEARLSDILDSAPLLCDLRFCRNMPEYSLSFNNITTLDADEISAGFFFCILDQFPALQRLKCFISEYKTDTLPIKVTTHQNLAVLKLSRSYILGKAVLPNLRDLQITRDDSLSVHDTADILSLVTRSSCALRSLGMSVGDARITEFYDFLAAFPVLETLDIHDCDNLDDTLEAILRRVSHLSRLGSLSVRAGSLAASSIDFEQLSVMLRRRDEATKAAFPIAKLKRLYITMVIPRPSPRPWSGEEEWSLDQYRDLITPGESASAVFRTLIEDGLASICQNML
ncbi:hypothetical protein R3P38DRAFT_1461157 [Favolaschia claudopus]|uniref:F-box domain-containing protein n=1 Tax=Favolaschia claudopus TaxID=2862362 RepID=A0AAW0DNG8_9AGAR